MSSALPIGVCRVVLAAEAALAVNNMAVRLLELNCFNEAQKSFQESLQLMKLAVYPNVTGIDIFSTLQAASVCLSQSQVQPPLLSHLNVVKSFEYGDLSALDTSFEVEPFTSQFLPVLLRYDDLDQHTIEDTIPVYTAMILYNQALAHLLAYSAASNTTSGSKKDMTVRNRLLKIAHTCLLSSRDLLSEQIFICQDIFEKLNMLVVVALVINRSVQMFHWSGDAEAEEALHTWIQIREYVREQLDGILGIPGDCSAAAA